MNIRPARRLALPLLIATWLACLPWGTAQAQPPLVVARPGPDFATPLVQEASVVVSIATTRRAAQGELGYSPDSFAVQARRSTASRDAGSWPRRVEHERELASGIVIGSDGEILTNAHVVADVERVIVRLADGRQFNGKVVGIDKTTDVALLKIDARGLPAATIGNSAGVVAGEWVVAIGSPFGLDSSATAGIVSAARRFLPGSAVPLIQSDVAINPGSSGGPLFNLRGEVVGINSMVFSLTGGYMGVSFSVPIDLAIRIADDLRSFGRVTRGQLGAKIQEVTPDLARSFGLSAALGALVLRVVRDSPAEHSGLRSGDVVLGIEGRADAGYVELQQDVAAARPGQTLALKIWRRGATQRIVLTVGEAPADVRARAETEPGRRDERLGLSVGEVSAARRDRLGVDGGVSVLEAHGAASLGGILDDDLIIAVGDRPVRDVTAFDAALAAAPADRPVALLVLRAGTLAYLAVEQNR